MSSIMRFLPAAISALLFLLFATYAEVAAQGAVFEWAYPWLPTLDVSIAFRVDSLSYLFALLITGVGAVILSYAAEYFKTDPRRNGLLWLLSLFALSMLGLVTADDALTLFLFWEGTTLTSYLLVGFDHHNPKARRNATQALLVTGLGGLALLVAMVLMHNITGSWRLSDWNQQAELLQNHALYGWVLLALFIGCFTKSAQFPFHFWLPNAMAAPTPVSAYLHSATMVKAGIYLLLRLNPALSDTGLWQNTLLLAGGTTAVLGAVWAVRQTDLKLMMAHTTVMALGTLVLLIGVGNDKALLAAGVFILVHALYKAALFLTVGMYDKKAGTRNYLELSGLTRMRITRACAVLGALSMAGLPPLIGFLGKELIYAGTLKFSVLVALVALAANLLMVVTALCVAYLPFTGETRADVKDPPWALWWGALTMGVVATFVGVLPGQLEGFYSVMTSAIAGHAVEADMALWHGINGPLVLSLATYALGLIAFKYRERLRAGVSGFGDRLVSGDSLYQRLLEGLHRLADVTTYRLQNGRMSFYLKVTFGVMAVILWAGILTSGVAFPDQFKELRLADVIVAALAVMGTVIVARTNSRLLAICSLGIVGVAVAIIFVSYGAIDVAMTQILVDTLMVVFIATALIKLPRVKLNAVKANSAVFISLLLGTGTTLAIIGVISTPLDMRLSDYFGEFSYTEALGRNVVNVILVDFRAFDTFGEVSVVVVAALAAVTALKSKPEKNTP